MRKDELLSNTLLLDLETTRSGNIRQIGAIFNHTRIEIKKKISHKSISSQLDPILKHTRFVLGHNLLGHDFLILKKTHPNLKILDKPVIDTLYLSPLAFPKNPYHHLVKDYKLVRSSINDPLKDAQIAASLFSDEWDSFGQMAKTEPEIIGFYHFCFQKSFFKGFSGNGLSEVFNYIVDSQDLSEEKWFSFFKNKTKKLICSNPLKDLLRPYFKSPSLRPNLAYVLSWLLVSGANSVLPPWVRYRFCDVPILLKALRETPCLKPACSYCRENHNPDLHLHQFFGFSHFRKNPKTKEGESLQRGIVKAGIQQNPLLAILPTGGGKSLCYQLPALIRYRLRGLLTVVISPLQALMKDQVDNLLKNTGTLYADAIYGMLTAPERGAVLNRIRLGDVAILYISPEQFRNRSVKNVLKQREIGCWVFDEAHCLSKWGHDFRPDYLYAGRFIREFSKEQKTPIAPISCFTATAKKDVTQEIEGYFKGEIDQQLLRFEGGVERDNLNFKIILSTPAEKLNLTFQLITDHMEDFSKGSVIVYAATVKRVEEIRDFLKSKGLIAEAFHSRLDAARKRYVIESFVAGEIPVISATNAFGMGIDKDNIRLVIHFEMPGSLENYLQEAGRAGRDNADASCILIFDPEDADIQFRLGGMSEVKKREIDRILKALRRSPKNERGEIILTIDELLRDDDLIEMKNGLERGYDTKVRTAIAWLERAGFLKRNQNMTDVFQGKPLVTTLDKAYETIRQMHLPKQKASLWQGIMTILFNTPIDRSLSADEIAEALFSNREELKHIQNTSPLTPAQIVIQTLHDMARAKLIDKGLMLSAILSITGKNNSTKMLDTVISVEKALIHLMQEEDPLSDDGAWVNLNVRRINQKLKNKELDTNLYMIRTLLKGLSYDGKGFAASSGSLELKHISRNWYKVRLNRNFEALEKTADLRQEVSRVLLLYLIKMAKEKLHRDGKAAAGNVLLSFSTNSLADVIQQDISLGQRVKKVLPAIDRALMFLHEQKAIVLQGGLAVFRQSMTIDLNPSAKKRRYNLGDFKPLSLHYREKRLQVHVMMEFARLGLEKIASALLLVLDYFSMGRLKFINTYFSDRKELIERAVTQEAYQKIVETLNNPVQISIVGSPPDQNMLVLAGPGSGKTRVIVHRCAYLLKVERISPRHILILCFNHNAAVHIKKRLFDLAGSDAKGVTVVTYHGIALRITGVSLRDLVDHPSKGKVSFDEIIKDATRLINGDGNISGLEKEEIREQVLAGYSHILVDEYQDIDQDQYDLVSAIAGRRLDDGKLSILAAGDDDQNIYTFRGANVDFIRKFKEDYSAKCIYMVENYRSTHHIIHAANQYIFNNRDRMKGEHPIIVNHQRANDPKGGEWEKLDNLTKGCVQVMTVSDGFHQAVCAVQELSRFATLSANFNWEACAIIARTRDLLSPVRSICEQKEIPYKISLESGLSLHRIREIALFLERLRDIEAEVRSASEIFSLIPKQTGASKENPWCHLLTEYLKNYEEETQNAVLPINRLIHSLYEALGETQREKMLGRGLFLGTIHSVKGMEFSHVVILDSEKSHLMSEEERRIFYVGITRAKKTLLLMRIKKDHHHLTPLLKKDGSICMSAGVQPENHTKEKCPTQFSKYTLLGLKEMYMDYAGRFFKTHSIHKWLGELSPGDCVFFEDRDDRIFIKTKSGNVVARLSESGRTHWISKMNTIKKIKVIAMLVRHESDPEKEYAKHIKTSSWELPLLEVETNGSAGDFS